ncbi:MAG: hypothetical protein HY580_03100 [Nitrospinae bacterium]|nr:hypothetical protein [Nitrospinota bacterium]
MDPHIATATLRGMILQALNLEYPNRLADEAILAMLQGAGYDIARFDLRRHLEYLSGPRKEYITLRKMGRDMWLGKLTPKGKDLLAGVIREDPGVKIAR